MADKVIPGIYRSYRKYKGVRGGDATRGDYRRERRAYLGNAEAVAGRTAAWDALSGRYWNVGRVAPVEVRDDAWLDSWADGYVGGMGDAKFDAGRYRDLYGRRHYDNYVGSLVSEGVPEEEADAMYWERFPAGPVDASSGFGAGEYFGNERGEAGARPVGLANMYFKYVNPLSAGALMGADALVDAYRSGDLSSVPVDLALAGAPLGGVKGFVREAAQGVKDAAKNNLKREVREEVNDNVVKAVADGGDDALELMRGAQGVTSEAAGKPEAAAQALQYLFKPYRGVGDDVVGGIYYRPGHPLQYKSGSAHAGKSGFGRFMERVGRGGVRSDVFVRKADLDAVPGLKLKTQAVKTEGLGNDARAFRKSVGENANPKEYVKVSTEDFLRSKAQPGEAADRLSDAVSAQLKAKTVSGDVPAYFNKYTQRNPGTFWRWNAGIGIGTGLVSGYRKAIGYGQNRDEWNKYTEGVANSGYNEFDSWINRQDKAVRDNAYRAVLNMRGEPGNEDESRYRQAEDAIVRQLVSEGYSAEDAYRMFNAWASGIMGIGEDTPDYYKCGGKLYAGGGPLKDARYNTVLSPGQEKEYAAWVETLPLNLRSDYDYDLRGAWLNGDLPDRNYHMSDRWKKPWHATFSDESVYSGDGAVGGHWYGDRFEPSALNRYVGGFRYGNWGAESFGDGGGIHIKKENRGKFTAAAERAGKSVQAYASQILADKGNYSPTLVKRANFARNAAKWHGYGGVLYGPGGPIKRQNLLAGMKSPEEVAAGESDTAAQQVPVTQTRPAIDYGVSKAKTKQVLQNVADIDAQRQGYADAADKAEKEAYAQAIANIEGNRGEIRPYDGVVTDKDRTPNSGIFASSTPQENRQAALNLATTAAVLTPGIGQFFTPYFMGKGLYDFWGAGYNYGNGYVKNPFPGVIEYGKSPEAIGSIAGIYLGARPFAARVSKFGLKNTVGSVANSTKNTTDNIVNAVKDIKKYGLNVKPINETDLFYGIGQEQKIYPFQRKGFINIPNKNGSDWTGMVSGKAVDGAIETHLSTNPEMPGAPFDKFFLYRTTDMIKKGIPEGTVWSSDITNKPLFRYVGKGKNGRKIVLDGANKENYGVGMYGPYSEDSYKLAMRQGLKSNDFDLRYGNIPMTKFATNSGEHIAVNNVGKIAENADYQTREAYENFNRWMKEEFGKKAHLATIAEDGTVKYPFPVLVKKTPQAVQFVKKEPEISEKWKKLLRR